MSAILPKASFIGVIGTSALCQKQTSELIVTSKRNPGTLSDFRCRNALPTVSLHRRPADPRRSIKRSRVARDTVPLYNQVEGGRGQSCISSTAATEVRHESQRRYAQRRRLGQPRHPCDRAC